MVQFNHAARPDASVARIGEQNGVGRQEVGQLLAQPLRTDWDRVGSELRLVFVAPVLHMFLGALHPRCVAARGFENVDETFQRALGVAQQPIGSLVGAAQLAGVNVNLDDGSALSGDTPV